MTYTAIPPVSGGGGGGSVNTITGGSGITVGGTPTDPVIINTLLVGAGAGQTVIGGSATTNDLTLRPNAADTTTGRVIVQGIGLQLPAGSSTAPSLTGPTTNTGWYQANSGAWAFSAAGTASLFVNIDGVNSLNNFGGGLYMGVAGQAAILKDGGTTGFTFTAGNLVRGGIKANGSWVVGTAALAQSAVAGFLYIPSCPGTPNGVPTAQTGCVPMIWDSTNKKFYIYDGAWLGGTVPGVFT